MNMVFLGCEKLMTSLYCRWLSEKEYEEISEYGIPVKKEVEKFGGKFEKMTKRPFGFVFETDGKKFQAYISGKKYMMREIANANERR